MRIYFRNEAYKTLSVEPEWTARILIDKVLSCFFFLEGSVVELIGFFL